jgi:23S rRNA (cytosine1962-C5)-methyltransferase
MAVVRLKDRREKSLQQRHPWVYSGAVDAVEGSAAAGDLVTVVDARGAFLGSGYYNECSKIRVRILSWDEGERVEGDWWRGRIGAAISGRADLEAAGDTTAYRLVHAEADRLPGLIVDRYGDVLVVQFLTAGVERVRDVVLSELTERFPGAAVYERSDVSARRHEGLAASSGPIIGAVPDAFEIRENAHVFGVNVAAGQKTGFYLDQRDNRRTVAAFAAGRRVLDAFCYTGAFSVYAAAAGAAAVTLADSSSASLDLAGANLSANGVDADKIELVHGDVFELLRALRDADRRFDMVMLDPPKFASNKHEVDKALRAYKDVNLLAMKALEPGGILATFSCSAAVDAGAFTLAVSWAGIDAGRDVQILHRLSQGVDHPILTSFPESEYLKGLVCRVV